MSEELTTIQFAESRALAVKMQLHQDNCSPAVQLRRITTSRIQDLTDFTIYEFDNWKDTGVFRPVGGRDRKVPVKNIAFITVKRGRTTFNLSYYEAGADAQIVKDLPLEMLPAAVTDLILAGFGSKADFTRMAQEREAEEKVRLNLTAAQLSLTNC